MTPKVPSVPTQHVLPEIQQLPSAMAQSLRKASELTMGDEMKGSGPLGFIQTCRTSKPPLSVASISFSQMEDSESLVRAYKKKKTELQTIQEQFYQVETQMITATQ